MKHFDTPELHRLVDDMIETMRAGEWAKKQLKRSELYKKTLGLLGAGRIATEVARRAQAFGMVSQSGSVWIGGMNERQPGNRLVGIAVARTNPIRIPGMVISSGIVSSSRSMKVAAVSRQIKIAWLKNCC